MQKYLNKIELTQNLRGVWDLDPFKGCVYSRLNGGLGCYSVCYAARIAKSKGYDFSDVVRRYFISKKHFLDICFKLKRVPFVRLGVMCDPSFDWEHTLSIIDSIRPYQKNIVVVTKHWDLLSKEQLPRLNGLTVNTSISALDSKEQIKIRLTQYNILKKYCNSFLRVNTCDFNDIKLAEIQKNLLSNINVIDNVLRLPKNHKLVLDGIINIRKVKFLKTAVYASMHKENVFFGYCYNCPDLCGIELTQKKLLDWIP